MRVYNCVNFGRRGAGWTRWRSGDSRLWVIERTKVFANVAAPPLTRDGQLPAQVARVLELPLPGQDCWLKHDVLFAAHVCTRLRASASASASASARLDPFPSRESFPVGLRRSIQLRARRSRLQNPGAAARNVQRSPPPRLFGCVKTRDFFRFPRAQLCIPPRVVRRGVTSASRLSSWRRRVRRSMWVPTCASRGYSAARNTTGDTGSWWATKANDSPW